MVARTITFDDYTWLKRSKLLAVNRVYDLNYTRYTIFESKIALSPYDDK